jgi:hypothetical protein
MLGGVLRRVVVLSLTGLTIAVPAIAAAGTSGYSIHIKAPHQAKAGVEFMIELSGSSKATSVLLSFLHKGVRCETTAKAAMAHKKNSTELGASDQKGSFHAYYEITPKRKGTYYICAYLEPYSGPSSTLARASSKFVAR